MQDWRLWQKPTVLLALGSRLDCNTKNHNLGILPIAAAGKQTELVVLIVALAVVVTGIATFAARYMATTEGGTMRRVVAQLQPSFNFIAHLMFHLILHCRGNVPLTSIKSLYSTTETTLSHSKSWPAGTASVSPPSSRSGLCKLYLSTRHTASQAF